MGPRDNNACDTIMIQFLKFPRVCRFSLSFQSPRIYIHYLKQNKDQDNPNKTFLSQIQCGLCKGMCTFSGCVGEKEATKSFVHIFDLFQYHMLPCCHQTLPSYIYYLDCDFHISLFNFIFYASLHYQGPKLIKQQLANILLKGSALLVMPSQGTN